MHFCWDELQIILISLPFLGMTWLWIRNSVGLLMGKKVPLINSCCEHNHAVSDLPIDAHKIGHLGEVPGTCVQERSK